MTTPDQAKLADTVTVEDVDDLDDVLDSFDAAPVPAAPAVTATNSKASVGTAATGKAGPSVGATEDVDADAFAKELVEGMEALMLQMEKGGDAGDAKGLESGMEALLKRMEDSGSVEAGASGASGAAAAAAAGSSKNPPVADPAPNFQDAINQTMNRLKDSSAQAKTETKTAAEETDSSDVLMAEMMRQMEQLADSGEFEGLLDGMMQQLMTRDVLYEPMKDLADKYPDYLAKNKDTLPADTYTQYEAQFGYVKQIMARFDELAATTTTTPVKEKQPSTAATTADEEEPADEIIADLMQKMQACGQPPQELLEEMAPGMQFDTDGVPQAPVDPEQCLVM